VGLGDAAAHPVAGVSGIDFGGANAYSAKTKRSSKRQKKHGKASHHRVPREVQVSRLTRCQRGRDPVGEEGLLQRARPDDLKNFGQFVVTPELAKVINLLFLGLNVLETIARTSSRRCPGLPASTRSPTRRRPTR
jgi:hypothetical protein